MGIAQPFDLPAFMLSNFPGVDFGGNLFGQRPTGMRFEIGIEQVSRATKLFEFLFSDAPDCVLVSQDWILEEGQKELREGSTSLFQTPGIFSFDTSQLRTLTVLPLDETPYRLSWTQLSPLSFNAAVMFQGIAHREQVGTPSILSGVYIIAPTAKVILHMYDDRGLDILARDLETLRPLYESFGDWILEDQRHRITFRFETLRAIHPA
jgi:hypothetical protein